MSETANLVLNLVLLLMILVQEFYHKRLESALIDKIMSRDFTEYQAARHMRAKEKKKAEPTEPNPLQEEVETLNRLMGV